MRQDRQEQYTSRYQTRHPDWIGRVEHSTIIHNSPQSSYAYKRSNNSFFFPDYQEICESSKYNYEYWPPCSSV